MQHVLASEMVPARVLSSLFYSLSSYERKKKENCRGREGTVFGGARAAMIEPKLAGPSRAEPGRSVREPSRGWAPRRVNARLAFSWKLSREACFSDEIIIPWF